MLLLLVVCKLEILKIVSIQLTIPSVEAVKNSAPDFAFIQMVLYTCN